ncbi:MAG: hypothetical protein LBG96_14570 [Tannerella sp.]|jgi:hypothetical protein|nr:hypothetical protein [Tannerella sp.]
MKKIKTITVGALWLISVFAVNGTGKAEEKSKAAQWLATQVDEYSKRVYVYADYGDSKNAFTQRGFMGENAEEPVLNEASRVAYSGITSIRATAPIRNGGWSGLVFANGILEKGSVIPRMDWGDHDAGVNLTGAKKLVIHARTADNETAYVEFKMGIIGGAYPDTGTKSSGLLNLSDEWSTIEIDLQGVDLSRIAGGFAILFNDANKKNAVTVYMDEIYYEFDTPRTGPLFLPSYEPVSLDKASSFINSYSYSYDMAMTVLALACAGKTEQAEKVADALLFAFENDRKFSVTERGVRNGYASGSPVSFPGWYSETGKSPFAKLAGAFDLAENIWKEDFYSDSYATGNNAWILLSFLKIYNTTHNRKYLDAALRLAACLQTLKDDINGGFKGGWDGFDHTQTKATYASTEHNIDLYSAFRQLGNIVKNTDKAAAEACYAAAEHAKKFVFSMYHAEDGFFYTGTADDGISTNNTIYPLDANTWAIQSFYNEPGFDAEKVMSYIENNFRDPASGFYKFSNKTPTGYWTEGSYQKIISDMVLGHTDKYQTQLAQLNTEAKPDGSITAANIDGLKTGFYTGDGSEWIYDHRVSIGATAWKALAELGVNVLDPNLYLDDVGNTVGTAVSPVVFINNGILHVKNMVEGEIIQVYSIAGKLLYQTAPSEKNADYPILSSSERILIVKGSSGWVKKVVQQG